MKPLALALALTVSTSGALAASANWRDDAAPQDVRRLQRLDRAWAEGLRQARREHALQLRALGAVGDPKSALARPEPAPGLYRCRSIKLGTPSGQGLAFIAYGRFRCRVELRPGGDMTLTKLTGSQRTIGHLYPDSARRLVYLGAVAWGADETDAAYGRDPQRDQIGVLERVGPQAWRLAMPYPRVDSTLDILELRR